MLGAVVILGAWVGLSVRLVQIQVFRAAEFAAIGLDQRLFRKELPPQRGSIFDRNGDPLALTIEAHSIYAVPADVDEKVATAQQLGAALQVDYEEILARLESGEGFVYVQRQVDFEIAEQVRLLGLPGIYMHPEAKRVYPMGTVAAQVAGIVSIDGRGIEGIELYYDELLTGQPGQLLVERDRSGRVIPHGRSSFEAAVPGQDLLTTLDLSIQFAAETACEETLAITGGSRCSLVVLDPETGDVLALAVVPLFDPAERQGVDGSEFSNFAVRDVYEPGSTQKLITVAAALEEGVVSPANVIPGVSDRYEVVDGACDDPDDDLYGCFRDFEHHDTQDMTVRDIFTVSSNVGTILIEQRLPDGTLSDYLRRFGLGQKTGIDYPYEASGAINVDPTCGSCSASAAIGYSVSVTTLQMAAAYGAVANDGMWMQPHLVSTRVDGSGAIHPIRPATRRVISEETAWVMRQLLGNVVEYGTGGNAAIPGYRVGGKTGTANKIDPSGGYSDVTVASFVGMAPVDDPKLVVAVVVDSPAFEFRTGSLAAAPAFAAVMEAGLHHLGVPAEVGS